MNYHAGYWEDIEKVLGNISDLSSLREKKVFITGAGGMICSAVVEILQYLNFKYDYNTEIFLGGRREEKIKKRFEGFKYKFVSFDAVKDSELDFKVDYIIHGASNSDPVSFAEQPVEITLSNIVGTNSLLKQAVAQNARLLYISSSEVYGSKEKNEPFNETDYGFTDILNPRNCYPCAKRAAENLCISYAEEYNADIVIVRPGHIYGSTITDRDSRATAQFTRNALNGENIVMKSAGRQIRSYCYTLDCASAILTVLLNGKGSNAYNISNKHSVASIRDIAEKFAAAGNVRVVFEDPSDAEKKGYGLMENSSLNSEKLESLNWKAVFDLDSGVKRTIEILRQTER